MSDLVPKRCGGYSTSQGDKKKLNKLRAKRNKLVFEQDIRDEAEKKGWTASESSFSKDDASLSKSGRMTSPPSK